MWKSWKKQAASLRLLRERETKEHVKNSDRVQKAINQKEDFNSNCVFTLLGYSLPMRAT